MSAAAERERAARHDEGWALVSVLWVVAALTLLAGGIEVLSATTYRFEHAALAHDRADAILDAGVVRALLSIEAPNRAERWPVDGTIEQAHFAGARLAIAVQDELGRFDLNAMDGSMLTALMRSQGASEDEAQTLSDRILDWRSPANGELHRLHGGTDADYAAAGLDYRPRHGAFQSVDELRLVLGMPPSLFERIRPALTVYSHKPMIDPAVAPRESLLALYGGDTAKVDDALASRQPNASAQSPNVLDLSLAPAGRTFTVTVAAELDGRRYTRSTVIMLTGDLARPYLVLAQN